MLTIHRSITILAPYGVTAFASPHNSHCMDSESFWVESTQAFRASIMGRRRSEKSSITNQSIKYVIIIMCIPINMIHCLVTLCSMSII